MEDRSDGDKHIMGKPEAKYGGVGGLGVGEICYGGEEYWLWLYSAFYQALEQTPVWSVDQDPLLYSISLSLILCQELQ